MYPSDHGVFFPPLPRRGRILHLAQSRAHRWSCNSHTGEHANGLAAVHANTAFS
jgi:hypothetical protein